MTGLCPRESQDEPAVFARSARRGHGLKGPDLELADVPLEYRRRFVAGDESVDGSGNRLGHGVAAAELGARRNGSLRRRNCERQKEGPMNVEEDIDWPSC